ncbi:MAG: type III secretion protein [Lentisphaeria bacterium]|nr:type III secretion protein [Lentisphaeria bacterium]
MAYALQNMLNIRIRREDNASAELSAARHEERVAQQKLEERRAELAEFESTKEERRDRIFGTVLGRAVSREELDLAFEGIARIDEEGVLKADNVQMATGILREKNELSEKARVNFVAASKERMKISEHKAIWEKEEAERQEHALEIELEDFTGKKNMENTNAD